MKELYTMSQKEISKLEVLQKLLNKQMKQSKAAQVLGISVRQVQRLVRQYRQHGPAGLISKKRGKPSNHSIPETIKSHALHLIKTHYFDFGPTLAAEKLLEQHEVKISVETVRKLMIAAALWSPKNGKQIRSYQPRYRRSCFGELIQIDGSKHYWFEERGPQCTLLVFVDDATSKITSLYFAPTESFHSYCLATKIHLEKYGKLMTFYSDKFSVFRSTGKQYRDGGKDKIMTQFGRALYELNIDLICANTCQAKGRVERANQTLQDRLVKELRLRDISNISDANEYLPTFVEDYNKRFGKVPENDTDVHRALKTEDDLDEILCVKEERVVSKNLTIQYDRILYLIEDIPKNRELRRKRIVLFEYNNGRISLNYKGRKLNFCQLYDRVQNNNQAEVIPNERIAGVLSAIRTRQAKRDEELDNKIKSFANISNKRIADTLMLAYQKERSPKYVRRRSTRCMSKRHLAV